MPADRSEALPTARRPHRLAGGQPGLLEPGASTGPYRLRLYRILRTDFPLGHDPGLGAWLLSRYEDVVLALTDPRFTGYPHDGAPRGPVPAPLGLCGGAWSAPRCRRAERPLPGQRPRTPRRTPPPPPPLPRPTPAPAPPSSAPPTSWPAA